MAQSPKSITPHTMKSTTLAELQRLLSKVPPFASDAPPFVIISPASDKSPFMLVTPGAEDEVYQCEVDLITAILAAS